MDKTKELNGADDGALQGFTIVGGFQDLSSDYRSIRVLRNDVVGLTIFANMGIGNEREAWRNRGRYIVAYESESGPDLQTEQVIVETDDSAALWRLWEMINAHVERIQEEIEVLLTAQTIGKTHPINGSVALDAIDVETIAGFDDADIKASVTDTLQLLNNGSAADAYDGFVNAVYSKVDDWLMARRQGKVNGINHHTS
jgi:hypothetical protein